MIVDSAPPVLTIDASTCKTAAGADWYPRRIVDTGVVHWFYAPRLRNGVERAAWWCSDTVAGAILNTRLSGDLRGGTPCPRCDAKWSMTEHHP